MPIDQTNKTLKPRLIEAVVLVNVRSLDHINMTGQRTVIFAEQDLKRRGDRPPFLRSTLRPVGALSTQQHIECQGDHCIQVQHVAPLGRFAAKPSTELQIQRADKRLPCVADTQGFSAQHA